MMSIQENEIPTRSHEVTKVKIGMEFLDEPLPCFVSSCLRVEKFVGRPRTQLAIDQGAHP